MCCGLTFLSVFWVSSLDLRIALLHLCHCVPSGRDPQYGVFPCCMCRVSLVSQGNPWLALRHGLSLALGYALPGRRVLAVVSTPQYIDFNCWSDQSSYSTLLIHCQQPQCCVFMLLFSCLWLQCNLKTVLERSKRERIVLTQQYVYC